MYYPQNISSSSSSSAKFPDVSSDMKIQNDLFDTLLNNDQSSTDPLGGYNDFLKELSEIAKASPKSDNMTKQSLVDDIASLDKELANLMKLLPQGDSLKEKSLVDDATSLNKELANLMKLLPQSDNLRETSSFNDTLQLNDVFAPNTNNMSSEDSVFLNDFKTILSEINNLGQEAAMQKLIGTYIDAFLEVEGIKKITEINNEGTRATQELDQQLMALRYNYLVLSKQVEQYVLDAQQAEQLKNAFFTLNFNMAQNSQSLTKTVVNAAKY